MPSLCLPCRLLRTPPFFNGDGMSPKRRREPPSIGSRLRAMGDNVICGESRREDNVDQKAGERNGCAGLMVKIAMPNGDNSIQVEHGDHAHAII
mmetsp:Transcript_38481/g.115420  ORF Transcript_38481/g.115420 Transcript_38481/m.115420 type:complete len:94 (-) Transcript_38481:256-537(-)